MQTTAAPAPRRERGKRAYLAGLAAESAAERHYSRQGYRLQARRWRCPAGEIDLVFSGPGGIVAVEVKSAATLAAAVESLRPRQLERIASAVEIFRDDLPAGIACDLRVDLFAVGGDGRFEVVRNITA